MYKLPKSIPTLVKPLDTSQELYIAIDLARKKILEKSQKDVNFLWGDTDVFFRMHSQGNEYYKNWLLSFPEVPQIVSIKGLSGIYLANLPHEALYFHEVFAGYPAPYWQKNPFCGCLIVPTWAKSSTYMENRI